MPKQTGKPWYTPEQNAHYTPSKADQMRARQFKPFASLRGYYSIIENQERIQAPRRELQDEDLCAINNVLCRVRKQSMVWVRYYDTDAYAIAQGMVTQINQLEQTLTVIKTKIHFSDIEQIRFIED